MRTGSKQPFAEAFWRVEPLIPCVFEARYHAGAQSADRTKFAGLSCLIDDQDKWIHRTSSGLIGRIPVVVQPLTAPAVRPDTMYFCAARNTIIAGMMVKVTKASTSGQFVEYSP